MKYSEVRSEILRPRHVRREEGQTPMKLLTPGHLTCFCVSGRRSPVDGQCVWWFLPEV